MNVHFTTNHPDREALAGQAQGFLYFGTRSERSDMDIDNPETDRLARELAAATGESVADAVNKAIRDRLRLFRTDHRAQKERREDVMKIIRDFRENKVGDYRSADEIIGYDERGLFY
jgi:antitoxin VapB